MARSSASTLRHVHGRAACSFADAEFLHRQLREELLQRLDFVRLEPECVLDLGAGPGGAFAALQTRYPRARLLGVDHAAAMLLAAPRAQISCICADATRLPLADASVDLVFCNLLLAYCADPVPVLAEVRRVLRAPGLLLFSALGPDTLRELRNAWREADDFQHVARFPDMHDLGDLVLRAGLAEPVLDRATLQVSYTGLDGLRADLRATGAVYRGTGRNPGLTGRGAAARLRAAVARHAGTDGRWSVTAEVIFGQAWGMPPGSAADGVETSIPVHSIRRRGFGAKPLEYKNNSL